MKMLTKLAFAFCISGQIIYFIWGIKSSPDNNWRLSWLTINLTTVKIGSFFLEKLGLSFHQTCVTIRAMTKHAAYENQFGAVVFVLWTCEMMKYVASVVTELNGNSDRKMSFLLNTNGCAVSRKCLAWILKFRTRRPAS